MNITHGLGGGGDFAAPMAFMASVMGITGAGLASTARFAGKFILAAN